ncbi:MAG: hypothetical protein ACREAE_01270 [Nitrosopumilaceae archaeon]
MKKSNTRDITNTKNEQEFAEHGDDIKDVMKFVSSCNSLSELIDKLCIENIRLWHVLDDTVAYKKELERPGIKEKERVKILEKIAKKSFENIETVKRRSIFKKAIDEVFILNVRDVLEGKNPSICNENKSYGRRT